MTVKLSELRVSASMDAAKYQAGMFEKVSADNAGAASSQRLGQTITQTYQRISQAGNVMDRLARTYVAGYSEATKFDTALRSLGRGLETGKVSLEQAGAILDGITAKFGRSADATALAQAGYAKLAKTVGDYNAAAKATTSPTSAGAINQRMGIAQPPDGSANRAADIAAYGKSLDDLRAKYAPLYAVERNHHAEVAEITKAHRVGALSSDELSAALAAAEARFVQQSHAVRESNAAIMAAGKGATLSSNAMANLSFQINDVATQAALGMPPLRILAAQGGQFYQILQQGEGGVKGSLSYLYRTAIGLITPFRLLVAGGLSLAAAGVAVASSWASAQRQINLALVGTGSAAGVTAANINDISLAAAGAGRATVSEARAMALAFVATGKISAGITEQLVRQGRDIGRIFGEDTEAAGQRLAKAFADPARGVDDLNARLAAWDATTVQLIRNLGAQGRTLEAQRLLLAGLERAAEDASQTTGSWTRMWDGLTAAVSRYTNAAGQALNRAVGNTGLEDQLLTAQAGLDFLMKARQQAFPGLGGLVDRNIAEAIEDVRRLAEQLAVVQDKGKAAAEALKGIQLSDQLREAVPNLKAFTDANNQLVRFTDALAAGGPGLGADDLDNLKKAIPLQQELVAGLQMRIANQKLATDAARLDTALALEAINARTAAQRADVAYRQTLERESRAGNTAAAIEAQAARTQILAQENRRVGDEIRNRNFAAKQAVDLAAFELSLIGKSADEAARLTAAFQAKQQVEAQAFQGFRTAGETELRAAQKWAEQKADYESQTRRAKLLSDLEFERQQYGRTSSEQNVYARMQSAGLLTNGQIVGAQAEAIAGQIRFNEQLERSIDLQKGFADDFLSAIMQGKSATEALGSALEAVAQKMLSNSLDSLFSGLTRTGGASGGGLFGGSILPGIFHDGGTVGSGYHLSRAVPAAVFTGAPRYHGGGFAGLKPDEVPAILQKGEKVLSRRQVAAGSDGGGVVINMPISIDATGAYPESISEITAAVAHLERSLPQRIIAVTRDARSRGHV